MLLAVAVFLPINVFGYNLQRIYRLAVEKKIHTLGNQVKPEEVPYLARTPSREYLKQYSVSQPVELWQPVGG